MRSRFRLSVIVVTAVLAVAAPVSAAWLASGSGTGTGRATAVSTAAAPTASATGRTVTLSWTATTLATGAPVTGYRVTRVNTVTAATTSATGGCAGTVAATSCVETLLPTGRWAYRLEAVRGAWIGPMGAQGNTVAVDATAPTSSAAVLQKTTGGATGAIRQGGTYRVYATVTDTGDPATGVASVTANVSALTTGSTAVALTAGSFTVGGVVYGYQSAQLTATNPQAAGTKTWTVTATDGAGNAATSSAFPVTVDNTKPAGADVQALNGGAIPGRAETGDLVQLTYTEAIDPHSVLAGWTGAATTVTVRLINNGGAGGDRIQIWNAANSTQLPLGTVSLTNTGYVTTSRNFTGSTMQLVGSVVVVTLGTPSGATLTVATPTNATWAPSATVFDPAGNTATTTSVTETGAADVQF